MTTFLETKKLSGEYGLGFNPLPSYEGEAGAGQLTVGLIGAKYRMLACLLYFSDYKAT